MAVIATREIFHTTHNIEEIEFIDEEIYQAPHSTNSFFTKHKVGRGPNLMSIQDRSDERIRDKTRRDVMFNVVQTDRQTESVT